MRTLTKLQNAIMTVGGILLIAGAAIFIINHKAAFVLYTLGVLGFGCMQMLQTYDGQNFIIRRLRRQQLLGVLALFVGGCCMCMQTFRFGFAIRNEWVVFVAIGAVLELWTAYRIPYELAKEGKKP